MITDDDDDDFTGNQHRDTECEKCISGTTYSTNALFERCKPCTKCRVYREPCSTTSDAVCQIPWSGRTNSSKDLLPLVQWMSWLHI